MMLGGFMLFCSLVLVGCGSAPTPESVAAEISQLAKEDGPSVRRDSAKLRAFLARGKAIEEKIINLKVSDEMKRELDFKLQRVIDPDYGKDNPIRLPVKRD
jgi:hypothetical protein